MHMQHSLYSDMFKKRNREIEISEKVRVQYNLTSFKLYRIHRVRHLSIYKQIKRSI